MKSLVKLVGMLCVVIGAEARACDLFKCFRPRTVSNNCQPGFSTAPRQVIVPTQSIVPQYVVPSSCPDGRCGVSLETAITGPRGNTLSLSTGFSVGGGSLLSLHNSLRVSSGLPPLTHDPALDASATAHSQRQADQRRMHHMSDSQMQQQRIAGENVAYGQSSDSQVFTDWQNSPGHRANILRNGFTRVGFGVASGADGRQYWTTHFGR